MSKKHCPKCNAVIEFAQCDYRICDNCDWKGSWQKLIDKEEPILTVTVNKELAEAIVDMENVSFSESQGAKSYEGCEEWRKLVEFVIKGFDLQDRIYNPNFR